MEHLSSMVRFWTLNHATTVTGISEEEIIAAGERREFPYQPLTKLIIDIGGFNRWVEQRQAKQLAAVIEEIRQCLRLQTVMLQRVIISMRQINL